MKFSMTRPVKIVMLGAGGTGGHMADCPAAREICVT